MCMDYNPMDPPFKYCTVCQRRPRLSSSRKHKNKRYLVNRWSQIRPNVQGSQMEQKRIQNIEENERSWLSRYRVRSTLPVVQGEEGVRQLQGHQRTVRHCRLRHLHRTPGTCLRWRGFLGLQTQRATPHWRGHSLSSRRKRLLHRRSHRLQGAVGQRCRP